MAPKKSNKKPKKLIYEDLSEDIDQEINKRRGSWYTDNIPGLDWEDVSQQIKQHIAKKWDLWDQDRAFKPWVNRVISNKLKNIYRNLYANYMPPCQHCPFNGGTLVEDGECTKTSDGRWSDECPIYAKWSKGKKHAWNIKIPAPMEFHDNEVVKKASIVDVDLEGNIDKIHEKMKEVLPEKKYKIYKMLYIDHIDQEEVAKQMGYKSSEKNRKAGYKHIKNMEKSFVEEVKKILDDGLM